MKEFYQKGEKLRILSVIISIGVILFDLWRGQGMLSCVAIVLCGVPLVRDVVWDLFSKHEVTADILVLAAGIALLANGEYLGGAGVIVGMRSLILLEALTEDKDSEIVIAHEKAISILSIVGIVSAVAAWLLTGEMINAISILIICYPCIHAFDHIYAESI